LKKLLKNPQNNNISLKNSVKIIKNSANQCLKLAWLKTKSKQMKTLKRRDQQRLSGDSIFQMPGPYHGRQAFSACSAVSAVKYYVKSGIYRLSNHYAYFTKQTQLCAFFAQKQGFDEKTNPIQTQSNPISVKKCQNKLLLWFGVENDIILAVVTSD